MVYKRKYNAAQRKAYKNKQKRKAKSYRNRQQLISIPTIKTLIKDAVEDHPEVKHIEVSHNAANVDTTTQLLPIAHPSRIGALATMPRPLITKIFDNDSMAQGMTDITNIGNQIFLKGIRIKLEILAPSNNIQPLGGIVPMMLWYDIHYAVVRQNKGTVPDFIHMPQSWWTNKAIHNKQYTGTTGLKKPDKTLFKGVWKLRPKVDVKISFQGGQTDTTCPQQFRKINRYIPINKKYNIVRAQGAPLNPQAYYLMVWCYAQKQGVSNIDGFYTNTPLDSQLQGVHLFNPRINYKYVIYYSDS